MKTRDLVEKARLRILRDADLHENARFGAKNQATNLKRLSHLSVTDRCESPLKICMARFDEGGKGAKGGGGGVVGCAV